MASEAYIPPRYVRGPEQAKMIRAALKVKFPGTKFSVRTSRGSAVDVRWTDGPTMCDVDAVTQLYVGGGFDGMQDLRYSVETVLTTENGAERVQFAQDFVFTHRQISDEWKRKLEAEIVDFLGEPFEPFNANASYPVASWHDRDTGGVGLARDTHRGEYGSTLVWQLAAMRDRSRVCDHQTGTYGLGNGFHRCKGCGMRCSTQKYACDPR